MVARMLAGVTELDVTKVNMIIHIILIILVNTFAREDGLHRQPPRAEAITSTWTHQNYSAGTRHQIDFVGLTREHAADALALPERDLHLAASARPLLHDRATPRSITQRSHFLPTAAERDKLHNGNP